jgi:hypothetical protein
MMKEVGAGVPSEFGISFFDVSFTRDQFGMICASLPAHEEKVRDICVWTPHAPPSNVTQGPRNARIGKNCQQKESSNAA